MNGDARMQGAGLREGLPIARYVQYTGFIRYSSPALPACMRAFGTLGGERDLQCTS